MKYIFLSLLVITLFSCEQQQPQTVSQPTQIQTAQLQDNGLASVDKVNGLYVFVNSKPIRDYDQLGKVDLNVMIEGVEQKESVGDIIEGMVGNAGFQDKVNNMIQKVNADSTFKDADGIVFNGKMDQCSVIKFK
jgi:hypothetical protein